MSAELPAAGRGPLELLRRLDLRVTVPLLLLVVVGLLPVASARPDLVAAQLRWGIAGFAALLALQVVAFRRLLDLAWPAWILSIVLLAGVLVAGDVRNGARRWISLGPAGGLQPSEFAKVAQVLVLARYIRFRRDHRTMKGLLVPFLLTLIPAVLVLMEPDLGTASLFVPVLFALLWAAGARTRHLLAVVALGAASVPLLWTALPDGHYQKERVRAFLTFLPAAKDAGATGAAALPRRPDTYQRDEAIAAVAGGGLVGAGFREGQQTRRGRVPEAWTDFAFVVHAEEWGFAGVAALLLLWTTLLAGLASLAAEVREPAGRLLCVGAMVQLGTQACLNMAMTMGLTPVTGVPLPFVSYGGSSMLASFLLVGLALHAKSREPLVFSSGDFD